MFFFFFQAEDGIRDLTVTGVQTCALPISLYGARHVGLKAGLKIETPAVTVNRLCGSGIEAIAQAARRLLLGEATVVLAGGMENKKQGAFVIRGASGGLKMGGGALEDSL